MITEVILMPRAARIKSKSKIYHIMIRGIDQQNIFSYEEDYERFLAILAKYCKQNNFEIHAYCLMDNHIHLLLKENKEPIATAMKRIGTSLSPATTGSITEKDISSRTDTRVNRWKMMPISSLC